MIEARFFLCPRILWVFCFPRCHFFLVEHQIGCMAAKSLESETCDLILGTSCGLNKRCFEGECLATELETPPSAVAESEQGWGPWDSGSCKSGCISKSKGFRKLTRTCRGLEQQLFSEKRLNAIVISEFRSYASTRWLHLRYDCKKFYCFRAKFLAPFFEKKK